jgi:hypothetical protein
VILAPIAADTFTAIEEHRTSDTLLNILGIADKLRTFLQHNRQGNSPELKFEQSRLEREVGPNQQVVTSLAQSYEEVRIREVRNTPVITVIEPPTLATSADPRNRTTRAVIGLLLAGVLAVITGFIEDFSGRGQRHAEANEFFHVQVHAPNDAARGVSGVRQ